MTLTMQFLLVQPPNFYWLYSGPDFIFLSFVQVICQKLNCWLISHSPKHEEKWVTVYLKNNLPFHHWESSCMVLRNHYYVMHIQVYNCNNFLIFVLSAIIASTLHLYTLFAWHTFNYVYCVHGTNVFSIKFPKKQL